MEKNDTDWCMNSATKTIRLTDWMIKFPHSLSLVLVYIPAARCYPEITITTPVVKAEMLCLKAISDYKLQSWINVIY